jgi:hypothetical protein
MTLERGRIDRLSFTLVLKMINGNGMPTEFFEDHRKAAVLPGMTLEMLMAEFASYNGLVLVEGGLVHNKDWEVAKEQYAQAKARAEEQTLEVARTLGLPEIHDSHF